MKQIIDKMTTPNGGWIYIEPTTGVRFHHLAYGALISLIRKHKNAMEIPTVGNWQDEVDDIISNLNPHVVSREIGTPEQRITADDIFYFLRMLDELKGKELVSPEEQNRRANICAICPKRGVVNCRSCGYLARTLVQYTAGRKLAQPEKIYKHSCMACKCDLTAKTAVPMDVLVKVDEARNEKPDYQVKTEEFSGCWMLED